MEYRKLGRTGLKVSALCLGTMTFRWTSTEAESFQVLDRAWDSGINFLDTADIYSNWAADNPGGVSEEIIGRWMQNKPRDQIILATKCRGRMGEGPNAEGLSRAHILNAVNHSLRRLKTDYIDLYQVHWPDWDTPLEETLRTLDDLVRQGKVRYLGASNFQAWYLMKALGISERLGLAHFASIQPHFHLLNRREVEPELALLCLNEGVGMIPYSPLASGFLTGKYTREGGVPQGSRGGGAARYMHDKGWAVVDALRAMGQKRSKTPAQMALAWHFSLPFITAPIIGANNIAQLDELLGAVGITLTSEEMQQLDQMTDTSRNYRDDD